MTAPPRFSGGRVPIRSGRLTWWTLAATLVACAASPPEVVQIRVPSSKVSSWFPPGTGLRVLPFDRFEEMVKAAGDRPSPPPTSRLLRARHSARWDSGRLIGKTELIVEAGPGLAPGLLILDPWSPALADRGAGAGLLRATGDGRLAVKVEPTSPPAIEFEWTLRARPGSAGRAFALDLPGVGPASLALDLPGGMTVEASGGPVVVPGPGESHGRSTWSIESARGRFDLRLGDDRGDSQRPGRSGLWLEGPTRVDLGAGPVNWQADWTLDESPGAARGLTIGLDPGLEAVDVAGPRVASSRLEPDGAGTRVLIQLAGGPPGPSPLTIRAICRVPEEGTWSLPSARPLDATWTGGKTLVRLDGGRVLQACEERSGRRVPARSKDPGEAADLVFEPTVGAGPLANLTFRKPTADATAQVRGRLRLADDSPRIDVAITWTMEKGRLLAFSADLPPGWSPDGVASASALPVAWHAEGLGNGGTRVFLAPSLADQDSRTVTLTLSASARRAGASGPLDLPRVRPSAGVRVVDEVWVAISDPGLAVRPILASGLAWLDPPDPPIDDVPTPWSAGELRGALAWRWLTEVAEARVDRTTPAADHRGEVKLEATIRSGRIGLDWTIDVESPREDVEAIPILIDGPVAGPILWKSREPGGPIIEARPMADGRRATLGFPSMGQAWELAPFGPPRATLRLQGRAESAWPGRGRLPLLSLPDRFKARGVVEVIVEDPTRVKVEATGLTPIEAPALDDRPADRPGVEDAPASSRLRKAGVFGYRSGGGRLAVETSAPSDPPVGGLVREATLVSHASPGAGMRHRLTLGIASESVLVLRLRMPSGVAVDRLRRDGLAVSPTPSGDDLLIEIPAPAPGRPFSSLTLDYRTEDDPRAGPIEPARLLPGCSLPCLGFVWEIIAPEPWALGEIGRGLRATDPRTAPTPAERWLGFHWSPLEGRDDPSARLAEDEKSLADLDRLAAEGVEAGTNLGDWLLMLDSGPRPLVVDRLAIRSAGWGPGSRIGLEGAKSGQTGPVRSVLGPMGLVAIPLPGLTLITSKAAAPAGSEDRQAWAMALAPVPAEDHDPTDRFQSAARWRGESTPRSLGSGESPGPAVDPGGWRTWRVVSGGWPPPGSGVTLRDGRSERAWCWLVASIVLVAGLLARDGPAKARAVGLGLIAATATIGLAWRWPEASSTGVGLLVGALGVLAFWLGRALRPGPSPTTIGAATASRRVAPAVVLSAGLALVMALGFGVTSVGQDAEPAILALLPFDGPADPEARPDRVVLRFKDYERLESLASREKPRVVAAASLVSASHKVDRPAPGMASFESRYVVEVVGAGSASWSFPVGESIELDAEVDGRPTPLAISPDGGSAMATLEGAGLHRVRFRRMAALSRIGRDGERARVPINRAAFARVAVAPGAGPRWVDVVGALGEDESLGPVDALEVRWFPGDGPPAPGLLGPVDATCLWDARAVGDLVRMRLVHSDPDGASAVRIAMGSGVVVRGHSIPNVVGERIEGAEARPEWVAYLDPPLPKDLPIEVDFWRPAIPGSDTRSWPDVDLPSAARLNGLIGFRRPSDWSGRLEPGAGIEPASESNFARAWGILPDDGLTLAGAVRLARSAAMSVETRPVRSRRSIRTKVVAIPAPGRLDVAIEAVLGDRQGRSFDLEVVIPNDLRIVRVEADGLLDWQKVAREKLRLQFDGSESIDRKVKIQAYLPSPADSVMSETRAYEARIPWPRWVEAEASPGTIEVVSPARFQFEPAEGTVAIPLATTGSDEPAFRSAFRVDRPSGASTVRWSAPPSKLNVSVDSELAVDPEVMTWTAAMACEVSGGPAGSLSLKLPTEWAEGASLEVEGSTHRLVAQAEGPRGELTQWTIYPDFPIWGRARLVLRSRRPVSPGREFWYPQIAPLARAGRGSVGVYDLALVNVSGRSMEVAGSSGLQPVEASRSREVAAWSLHRPSRSHGHAYHVTGEKWSLRLKVGRAGDGAATAREARVAAARLACVLGLDGSTWGRACFELEPRPGPFLALRLPEGVLIPWVSVDGAVGTAFLDGPGRWLVPLGDGGPRRVVVAWHDPSRDRSPEHPGPVALPMPDRPPGTTLIAVEAPEDVELSATDGPAERIERAGWELENIELLAGRVVEAMNDLDRGSRQDRDAIVDNLVEIECRKRHLSRLKGAGDLPAGPAPDRLQAAVDSIAEASQAAGLEDLVEEAGVRVGVVRAGEDSAGGLATATPEVVRLRRSGVTSFFRAKGRRPTIERSARPPARRPWSAGPWAIAGAGLGLWIALGGLVVRGFRPSRRTALGLVLTATLALAVCEPLGLIGVLGLLAWGRATA